MAATSFTTVTVEGGLLPAELLARVAHQPDTVPGTRPEDYRLTPGKTAREVINRAWNDLSGAWTAFRAQVDRLAADDHSAHLTWDRWLLPLLGELGWGRIPRRNEPLEVDGKEYPVSHQDGPVLFHLLGWNTPIDRRTPGVRGAATAAPHSLLQEALNRTDDHLWGIVSNGRRLRLIRDNSSLTRAAYVEFDIEAMFDTEQFADFVLLWMLVHASRLDTDPQHDCWLERWAADARAQGIRALDHLRDGFEDAIKALGSGFLAHPANNSLRDRLGSGALSVDDYYRQVLRVVYRLVFVLVAEDRELLHAPGTGREASTLYARFYSLGRLREMARRRRGTLHADQWEQVRVISRALHESGLPALGIPALGSSLWDPASAADLDGARLSNTHLLTAIRALAYSRRDAALQRVDYRNLGAEELGSIYESLLELRPRLRSGDHFDLVSASGNERKTTGSYYTPTPLISALLGLSLDELLDEAERADHPEAAILALKVLDPAVGSGHFLAAAGQRIANRLAMVRTGEANPTPEAARHALRDVVARCLYGIDVNPMAVELCKVNLWLEGVEPGKPLSFLDHHIVCGNGVLGATPRLLAEPLPERAFEAIEGDDKAVVTARRRKNKQQRTAGVAAQLSLGDRSPSAGEAAAAIDTLTATSDETLADIRHKAEAWDTYQHAGATMSAQRLADAWCAGFVATKTGDMPEILCTTVRWYADDPASIDPDARAEIERLTSHYRFLHPHLAFPDVFAVPDDGQPAANTEAGWNGGFDLVLGNPPWDTLSPDAKEFFANYDPQVRFMKKADQQATFDELLANPGIAARWQEYRRDLFATVHLIKRSGRYRLFAPGNLGKGDFNVYRMFVETALLLAERRGFAAQVTPSGLYNGANAQAIRAELFDRWDLKAVLGMINKGGVWFPGIDATTRFAMYAARRGGATQSFGVAFGINSLGSLAEALPSLFELDIKTVRAQSEVALAISETAGGVDAEITDHLYRQWPAFGDTSGGPPMRRYQREIDMGSDRDLFGDDEPGLPLYEGRMIGQLDHRAKAYRSGRGRSAVWADLPFGSPEKAIVPQWFVPASRVPAKVGDRVNRYRMAFSDVARPDTSRSLLAALIPPGVISGHKVPTFTFPGAFEWMYLPWLAVANSLLIDFLIRKKITLTVALSLLDSMPIARLRLGDDLLNRLAPLVLRLTCTGPEMSGYWNSMAVHGWCELVPEYTVPTLAFVDDDARAEARAEIDAVVAKYLYRLDRAQLEHIISTFPTLERNETRKLGEFRTKRLVLDWFDKV